MPGWVLTPLSLEGPRILSSRWEGSCVALGGKFAPVGITDGNTYPLRVKATSQVPMWRWGPGPSPWVVGTAPGARGSPRRPALALCWLPSRWDIDSPPAQKRGPAQ